MTTQDPIVYPTRITIHDDNSPSPTTTTTFIHRDHRCCFHLPCFGGSTPSATSTPSLWDRIRVAESEDRWWARPITAFKKIREWSEIVAGPKWKTFIRRFNRRHRHHHAAVPAGKFHYDPLSYALNFDEGPGQNGQFEDDYGQFPDFSSRFAPVPLSAKSSMDLGHGGPPSG